MLSLRIITHNRKLSIHMRQVMNFMYIEMIFISAQRSRCPTRFTFKDIRHSVCVSKLTAEFEARNSKYSR